MNDINITEKYTLFILKDKKNLYAKELTPYLVTSMIIEMMLDENLDINEKDIVTLNEKLPTTNYNKKLYEIIKDMNKKEIPLKNIISSICFGFSTKKIKSIVDLLKNSMLEKDLITFESKKGLFGSNKEVIKINETKFNNTIEEIKLNILEKKDLTDELILLASLLNSSKFIKNIFNKYEKEKLDSQLKEIKKTDIAKKVKIAQNVISNMSAITTMMMINATRQYNFTIFFQI